MQVIARSASDEAISLKQKGDGFVRLSGLVMMLGMVWLTPSYLSPEFQAVSDHPFSLETQEKGFLFTLSPGVAYLVHPIGEDFDFDNLTISLQSNQKLELTVIPNITTTANFTYEFQETINPSSHIQLYTFSLRHPYFKDLENIGFKFVTPKGAKIYLQEISFSKHTALQKIFQPFRDFFRVSPYSGFTVNVFPTPRIFGRSAFLYFLPLFLILLGFFLFSKKHHKKAMVALLLLWLLTDFRMSYEFFSYSRTDYHTWIKPPLREKTLRTYGDFYVFAKWLEENLPRDSKEINFYYPDNEHFPRLLQYYLYPVQVYPKEEKVPITVVFHRLDLKENFLTKPGQILSSFSEDSFIYLEP